MLDTVAVITWVFAGVAGGNAAGELLKGHYDLGYRRISDGHRRCEAASKAPIATF